MKSEQESQMLDELIGLGETGKLDYPDKIAGGILGFAIGDALGAPVEFSDDGRKVTGYEAAPRKGLLPGQYTDDTQHLEIGLDSLLRYNGEINVSDQAERLVEWYKSGKARSIGRTTRQAIENLIGGADTGHSGVDNINSCGSLAIPRLIPFLLLSAVSRYKNKIRNGQIKEVLGLTHAHKYMAHMGNLFGYMTQEIMNGKSMGETLDMILFENDFLNKRIRRGLSGVRDLSQSDIEPYDAIKMIGQGGFVKEVLFSSIYAVLKGKSFEEAVLLAANGGGDSDSRAAFTGTFYGMYIGASNLPANLKEGLERSKELEVKAREIYQLRR